MQEGVWGWGAGREGHGLASSLQPPGTWNIALASVSPTMEQAGGTRERCDTECHT